MKLTITIPDKILNEVMSCCDSAYWARVTKKNGKVYVEELVNERLGTYGKPIQLTAARKKSGFELLATKCPKAFYDILNEDPDAATGDAWLQCAILGGILYG